jgi:hypothetical protein
MGSTDPRVDAYVEKSAPFARPILTHIRRAVHAGCPDVEETMNPKKASAPRARRIATAVEWLSEGKSRNWKYERKR